MSEPLLEGLDLKDSSIRPMIATLHALPGKEESFRVLLTQLAVAVREEPGCVMFLVYEAMGVRGTFFIHEVYRNNEAFALHLQSDAVERFKKSLHSVSTSTQASSIMQLNVISYPDAPSHRDI